MNWFRKFICVLFGHNDNTIILGTRRHGYPQFGGSTWGYFRCSRCGRDETFQYDE